MRVLVACEFSGAVRRAFHQRGHDAWSFDLLPAVDGSPYHVQGDVTPALTEEWDLMIAFPPCTYLTIAAEWAYADDANVKRRLKPETLYGAERRNARADAIRFVEKLLTAPIPKIALENPVGVLSTAVRKPDQIIQPWQFGHPESKATCLWLKGLPLLRATNVLSKPESGRWANQTPSGQNKLGPSADRALKRSITYEGIARAMAEQWGEI
jgi:hypothetical protein